MNEKPPLGQRIKSWLIARATASLLPRLLHAAVITALAYTFKYVWPWIVGHSLDGIISPQTLSEIVSQAVTAIVLLTASAAIGKPVKEIQAQAKGLDLYDGEIDGDLGTKTKRAISVAVNNPNIQVIDGQLVELEHNAP